MRKGGGRNRVGISTHSPEAMRAISHPRQRGAGRRRGKLVGGSGEPGELADAEEDWSETQGSQGSWQMQRKIGQWLRGARGATWLERFASLKAVCAWIEGRSRVW